MYLYISKTYEIAPAGEGNQSIYLGLINSNLLPGKLVFACFLSLKGQACLVGNAQHETGVDGKVHVALCVEMQKADIRWQSGREHMWLSQPNEGRVVPGLQERVKDPRSTAEQFPQHFNQSLWVFLVIHSLKLRPFVFPCENVFLDSNNHMSDILFLFHYTKWHAVRSDKCPHFLFLTKNVPNRPLSFGEQLFNYVFFFFLQIQASRNKGLSKGQIICQYSVVDKINTREYNIHLWTRVFTKIRHCWEIWMHYTELHESVLCGLSLRTSYMDKQSTMTHFLPQLAPKEKEGQSELYTSHSRILFKILLNWTTHTEPRAMK